MQAFKTVEQVKDLTQAADVALSGPFTRSRPCVARDGKRLLVCSPRTARKYGWKIEGRLFTK